MATKICSYGGCKSVAISDTSRCAIHTFTYTPQKRRYEHQLHDGKYIYGTARWKRLRSSHIRLYPLCIHCQRLGLVTPGAMVDHVKELKDGGDPWDPDNLETLCDQCHKVKTGREVKRRKETGNKISDF